MSSQYDLADVPEEEEATRYWDSPESSVGCPDSRSVSQASPPSKTDSPSVGESNAPMSIFVAEELSRKFSEALGSPTLPQHLHNSNTQVEVTPPEPIAGLHQFSYEDEMYDSWDADIDYCYEHAAESTSNFDWTRTSLDESRPQIGVACSEGPWLSPKARHLQPSPLSTSELSAPDLNPSPASMPTHSAATPSSDYGQVFRNPEYFPISTLGKIAEPLYGRGPAFPPDWCCCHCSETGVSRRGSLFGGAMPKEGVSEPRQLTGGRWASARGCLRESG